MKRILKYHVMPPMGSGPAVPELPRGARILSAGAQGENLVIWALVDHAQTDVEVRPVEVIPTGAHLDEERLAGYDFVDTVQMSIPVIVGGHRETEELVWHVWVKA